jgi:alpha-beta hydrolase superfamily lysophospholipase
VQPLKFVLASLFFSILLAGSAVAWTEEDVSDGGLHGTLILFDDGAEHATVLILAGSGPVDRDGNLPGLRNNSLKLLAHGLADKGIASLRIDKRGIGESRSAAAGEEDVRLGTFVDDTVRWVGVLRRRGAGRIFILGHSEGALIATPAAQKTNLAGLIIVAGAGEPASQLIERQLNAAGVSPKLQEESKRISSSLLRGVPVADVPAELKALYRPSVQPYLMSWLPVDPAAELSRVTAPVLIVQGTTDLQVTMSDAQSLAAARANAKLVVIEGMNHVLKEAPAERAANLKTYGMPEKPLAPELLPAIASFIDAEAE